MRRTRITRAQLLEALQSDCGLSVETSSHVLDGMLQAMTAALVSGDGVRLRGFGSLTSPPGDGPKPRRVRFRPSLQLRKEIAEPEPIAVAEGMDELGRFIESSTRLSEHIESILEAHAVWLDSNERSSHPADLSGRDLNGVDLFGATLKWANLSGAILPGAELGDSDLEHANLERANLEKASLAWCNLRCCNLKGACLRGSDLRSADLSGADLSNADLTGANLTGAVLKDAILTNTLLERAAVRKRDTTGSRRNSIFRVLRALRRLGQPEFRPGHA